MRIRCATILTAIAVVACAADASTQSPTDTAPAARSEAAEEQSDSRPDPVKTIVPDLAALAAQADALSQGRKKYEYPSRKKRLGSESK